MASTFPAKSRPLHNFTLPELKLNDGHVGAVHQRRRSVKSPSRGRIGSMASFVCQSLPNDFVSEVSLRHQSPLGLGAYPAASVDGEHLGKRSPTSAKSLKPHRIPLQSGICSDSFRHLYPRENASESVPSGRTKGVSIECRRTNPKNSALDVSKNGASSSSSQRTKPESASKKQKQVPRVKKEVDENETKRSATLIRFPQTSSGIEEDHPKDGPSAKIDNKDEEDSGEQGKTHIADEETKMWNLRPRKPKKNLQNVNGGIGKSNGPSLNKSTGNLKTKSREREGDCGYSIEKKEKHKLNISVTLSKEEIEEDIFVITGSKPTKRPKKRPKHNQKHIDSLFPGGWLQSITADSYKI